MFILGVQALFGIGEWFVDPVELFVLLNVTVDMLVLDGSTGPFVSHCWLWDSICPDNAAVVIVKVAFMTAVCTLLDPEATAFLVGGVGGCQFT